MSTSPRSALLLLTFFLAASGAAAHGTGEPHVHAQAAVWLDALVALLVLGSSSAFTAHRATADGRLRASALWATRLCAVGAAFSAVAALLPASWLF